MSYCTFCKNLPSDNIHRVYHDEYYGIELTDDFELFGRFILEINQAGLSWETILKKQDSFFEAYDGFDFNKIAHYDELKINELLANSGVIRNRLKIKASIHNAQIVSEIVNENGSFSTWLKSKGELSLEEWVKLFKKNFKFVGKEIVNEFLMSINILPGAHDSDCEKFKIKKNSMKNLKLLIVFLMTVVSLPLISQISINAGTGLIKGFTVPKPFFGFHGGIELPRSNDETFYGRIGYYFPQKEDLAFSTYVTAADVNTFPNVLTVNYVTKTNYFTIEGGTRRYLGNDYDNGFSLYGGTNAMLIFNTVKRDYEKYDATGQYQWEPNYLTSPSEQNKGNVLSLAVGLQGGLKYTIPATGTLYFDINGQYAIFGKANNTTASNTNLYSQLFFSFNFGFRKDLY